MSGFYSPLPDPAQDWLEVDRALTGTRIEPDEYDEDERRHFHDLDHLPASASLPQSDVPQEETHVAATADLSQAVAATVPNLKEKT